jgi:hypothetical protein
VAAACILAGYGKGEKDEEGKKMRFKYYLSCGFTTSTYYYIGVGALEVVGIKRRRKE